MRLMFTQQLDTLKNELIHMGALCEDAIQSAVDALLNEDNALVERVIAIEDKINNKERDIETLCLKLLLQQQPVARDLRLISSALKMISDMERIGDQAMDISELSVYMRGSSVKSGVQIARMAEATKHMVTGSVDSFVSQDLKKAREVIAYDDVVDNLFNEIKGELVRYISTDGRVSEACLDLLMTAKYLERIGDHAGNIAEWVVFAITGEHINGG